MKQYSNYPDLELVKRLIDSDTGAFEEIYSRYINRLFSYVRKNISVKEDCEEIIQEIFESLWNRRSELDHVIELNAYLHKSVKYKIIRYVQHRSIIKKYEEHYKLFEATYDSIDNRDFIDVRSAIMTNISTLPKRCQYALELRLFEDLSNAEIAKRMNIGKATVENYIVKALNHLKANKKQLVKLIKINMVIYIFLFF